MEFVTKIDKKYIDINGLNTFLDLEKDIDVSIETATASVYWLLQIEARDYGIKDISAVITKVSVEVEVEYWEDNDDETDKIYKDFSIEISDHKLIKNEIKITDSSLYPSNIELNLGRKEHSIEVS